MEPAAGRAGSEVDLGRLLVELRPRLHRYCARMTGSVVDGEDVVQDVLARAVEAFSREAAVSNPEGWLFRMAHNAALDFLRRRSRRDASLSAVGEDGLADPDDAEGRLLAAASLRTFMRLPVTQRGAVILKDVLGHSLQDVAGILETRVPAVKSALSRGRARLRALRREPDGFVLPALTASERSVLSRYVDRFNARDFDAVRDLLADEVRLDLVSRARMSGKAEVSRYLTQYAQHHDWLLAPGAVEGRPALLVRDPADRSGAVLYFVLLEWRDGRVAAIRDFRYARYAMEGADVLAEP
jgi:RNA polymerase sigma-70 factor (ECF subfamily)